MHIYLHSNYIPPPPNSGSREKEFNSYRVMSNCKPIKQNKSKHQSIVEKKKERNRCQVKNAFWDKSY